MYAVLLIILITIGLVDAVVNQHVLSGALAGAGTGVIIGFYYGENYVRRLLFPKMSFRTFAHYLVPFARKLAADEKKEADAAAEAK